MKSFEMQTDEAQTTVRKPLALRPLCGLIAGACLCFAQTSLAQQASPVVTKAQSMRTVRVASVPDWQEVISDEGCFRILFPGKPEFDNEVTSVKGFKLRNGERKWSVFYSDLETSQTEEHQLRTAYRRATEAAKSSGSLLVARDVFLNGRLGLEEIIEAQGAVFYTRVFVHKRRVYVLGFNQKGVLKGDALLPADVRQFFDSFTYWDISKEY